MARSRHLVDPQLLPMLEMWPTTTVDEASLPLLRGQLSLPIGEIANPNLVEKKVVKAPGRARAPDVPLTCYRPADRRIELLPCIFHIHGGGYIGGRVSAFEPMCRQLVEKLGCAVVSVDYRLAPETAFPGPLEDCYTGLGWVASNAETLGIDASRIGIMGESAGGGLAAGLALLARDRGEHRLLFQHLIYPMLDDRTCTTLDPHPFAGEFIWNAESNAFGWRSYLGGEPGAPDVSQYAAASRAADLAGLPPTFISTGTLDLFIEEDVNYGTRLIRAGVPTEMHLYPGSFHGFYVAADADVARRAQHDSLSALKRFLAPHPI